MMGLEGLTPLAPDLGPGSRELLMGRELDKSCTSELTLPCDFATPSMSQQWWARLGLSIHRVLRNPVWLVAALVAGYHVGSVLTLLRVS